MCFTKGEVQAYMPQLKRLTKQGADPSFKFIPQHKVFVVMDWKTDTLFAYAVLGKPHGHWYFRNCVVDRKHRGNGYQRELIRQRLDYIEENGGGNVSVGVDPKNTKSLNNLQAQQTEVEGNLPLLTASSGILTFGIPFKSALNDSSISVLIPFPLISPKLSVIRASEETVKIETGIP